MIEIPRVSVLLATLALLFGLAVLPKSLSAQEASDRIRLNQIGFYPSAQKTAVVVGEAGKSFSVVHTSSADTVYSGPLTPREKWSLSGEVVRRATFTDVERTGEYRIHLEGVGTSHPFEIGSDLHQDLATSALKAYYYQRASTALPERHAGKWARSQGHPDDSIMVHASAATETRPAGTVIQAPKGWYDAGDYNKYVVNSGISTYTLLALYEHYPDVAEGLSPDIPENGNRVPDLLDEARWNLEWMLDMQAPDGGVYHKLTHPTFSGMVMPSEATAPRYIVKKGTAAALNFAAVMAQASRIYEGYSSTFPGLADSMRTAALAAWQWAREHPNVPYNQSEMNDTYEPAIQTGAYGDENFSDEFSWAAAELAVTTGRDSFLAVSSPLRQSLTVPTWNTVQPLGWITLLEHRNVVASAIDTTALKTQYLEYAEGLVEDRRDVPYRTVMGHEENDFMWGSNSEAANQALVLLQAERVTDADRFRAAALANLDYLLGRNATGYSFVTAHGDRSPMHIHHRPSAADGVDAPVPGMLAGGPNPGQQDAEYCEDQGIEYPSDRPAQSYVDGRCSYASNEVTINWNAPLVYVAAVLEAEYGD